MVEHPATERNFGDQEDKLAAGTLTGGLTNKLYGRVGDSPIISAGSYADNATVAASGTCWKAVTQLMIPSITLHMMTLESPHG